MKKHMTRNIILMLVLDVILGIVLAPTPARFLLPITPTPTPTAPTPPVRRAV